MITKLRPRRSQATYRLTTAGLLTGADLILTQDVIGYQEAREHALLTDCLQKLDALNNSGTHTNSGDLRDRLRAALNLPREVVETVPEMAICAGCGAYIEDGCQCGNYPPDGWREDALLDYCREECDRLQLPTLAERLAESIRDDRAN